MNRSQDHTIIDELVHQAVFADPTQQQIARFQIWQMAIEHGIVPSSIHELYMARGRGEITEAFTVPAFNIRGMTYDSGRALFGVAKKMQVGAFICELARSEMIYTDQPPLEYSTVLLAAALREGWTGPVFLQCDHFQAKAEKPGVPVAGELDAIKELIQEAFSASMFNVDIDMSTLVDLSQPTEIEQQAPNRKYTLELTKFIREYQPEGVTVSIGGEIGHIGGKNSTVADFTAFMDGYTASLPEGMTGMSKVSIQTGTSHGGVVNADGSLQKVQVDFELLHEISEVGRERYGIGGAVQHGASTLPEDIYYRFPQAQTLEIHLATGLQNILFDSPAFPAEKLSKIYAWLDETKQNERGTDETDEQFHYKLRKKAWGEFKQELWEMPEEVRSALRQSLVDKFELLFTQLGVTNTQQLVAKIVTPVVVERTQADFAITTTKMTQGASDLAD